MQGDCYSKLSIKRPIGTFFENIQVKKRNAGGPFFFSQMKNKVQEEKPKFKDQNNRVLQQKVKSMMQVLVHYTAMVGSLQLWFLIHFVNDWQYWPSLILCTACCTLEHSSCALIRKAMWPPGFIPDTDAASKFTANIPKEKLCKILWVL